MKTGIFVSLFAVLLLKYSCTNAQRMHQLKFDALGINNGLSQGMVNSIIQDHFGFMWFGTKDGLNRYDGYKFIIYRHNVSDANSLADNFVRFLFEDSQGRLWIATANNGLDMFDRKSETFIHFRHDELNENSLSDDHVTILSEDKFGCIWAGTVYGLNRILIEPNTGKEHAQQSSLDATSAFFAKHKVQVIHIVFDQNNPEKELYSRKENFPLTEIYASDFCIDQNGTVWVSTYEMLFKIYPVDNRTHKIEKLNLELYNRTKEFDNGLEKFVEIFVEDTIHKKLYMVFEYGITEINLQTPQITFLSEKRHHTGIFAHPAAIDADGNIWTGENVQLEWFNVNSKEWVLISSKENTLDNMIRNVNCSYHDQSGNIWIGTKGYGLLKYNPRSEKFHTTDHESIGWLHVTPDQKIIVTKQFYFLNVFDPASDSYSLSSHDTLFQNLPDYINFGITECALQDSDGTFWIGKQRLVHFDPATKRIDRYRTENVTAFPLFDDGKGNLWFSTENAFICFNKSSKKSAEYSYPIRPTRVPYDFLQSIYRDKKEIFWLGTVSGMLRFDPFKNEWKHFKNIPADTTSLSFDLIFSICPDPAEPDKYLWIGTNGGGLNRFQKSNGKFTRYTEENGLPNDVVYGILSDADNQLWMSTNKGISRFDVRTKKFRNFEEKDGLQGNEFNRYAFCKTKSGILYFGGVNGFNYFDPKELRDNTFIPNVLITDFKINNQSITIKNSGSVLKSPAYLTHKIQLNYSQNIFSIEFASLDFTASANNNYEYQLDGFDNHWIQSGNNNTATFTNLNPGTYTFKIKGSNNDGVWNEKATELTIIILPPWYMTTWFRCLIVLIIAGSVYMFYKYRINKILEMLEVRNTIARDLHDEIGSNLSTISIFSEVAATKLQGSDEVNTLLKKISHYTQQSQEAMSDIVWMINSGNDRFENIIFRMQSHASEVISSKNIGLNFSSDKKLNELKLGMKERRSFYLIFKEAINNLVKHSEASEVSIQLVLINNALKMTISDNGKGFTINNGGNGNNKNGNGLNNMHKRAEALNGKISLQSSPGQGTLIEFIFNI